MIKCDFERLAVEFVTMTADRLEEEYKSLVFSSTLCARSSDFYLVWHPVYREKNRLKLILESIKELILSPAKCIIRLVGGSSQFPYAIYGNVSGSMLVVSSNCGKAAANGSYRTAYVKSSDKDGIFVFGDRGSCGVRERYAERISILEIAVALKKLLLSGIIAFWRNSGNYIDRVQLLLMWLEWVLSLKWLQIYYLEKTLFSEIEKNSVAKIGCINEMNIFTRPVWRTAHKCGIKGYTVQHAEITEGKRWYFTYPEERRSGLRLPSVMYLYNEKLKNEISSYFDGCELRLGCSSRYARWKNVTVSEKKGRCVLFAGALAGFDNNVLFAVLRRLLPDMQGKPAVRIRLHKAAEIRRSDRGWLDTMINKCKIEISSDVSLKNDIDDSMIVIGMSTTVLEEALLMGKPVIQIIHPDYMEYIDINGIAGARKIAYDEISCNDLTSALNIKVNSVLMREKLGLNNAEVTYRLLFS